MATNKPTVSKKPTATGKPMASKKPVASKKPKTSEKIQGKQKTPGKDSPKAIGQVGGEQSQANPAPAAAMNGVPPAQIPPSAIVGIGASAGGLEAFVQFFRACPVDTGMAFVLVPHLDPGHASLLTEILQRATRMQVVQALGQTQVQANCIYVIPPNREMSIFNRELQLSMPELARGQRMPVDAFLRSLAEDQGDKAIGIVLSGTASDGTLGLRAIHGAGGICMVQDPATAKYDGMPQSAIASGYATHVLPVEKMPAMLQQIIKQSTFNQMGSLLPAPIVLSGMNQILQQIRSATGHDFTLYKKSTIGRRIERRMAKHNIDTPALYARFLKDNRAEVQVLFKELLINVTSFFRDPEAFVALKKTILPPMLTNKPEGYLFRVWVAGCASGEEAYSIAMVLSELMDEMKTTQVPYLNFQIYATDLDDDAIAVARAGRYPPNIAQDVTVERLRRYFTKDQDSTGGYKIKKEIRDMVVFATQNVVKDPPFTKLDLLSCRNLMIYLEPELQNRLIKQFHYALKPDGVLFLSASESITGTADLFALLDRKWKLYRASHPVATDTDTDTDNYRHRGTIGNSLHKANPVNPLARVPLKNRASFHPLTIGDMSHRVLLQSYAPASVTTDTLGNILFVHGDTGKYLRPTPGPVSNNVIEMAREGLQHELRSAIFDAVNRVTPTRNRKVSVKTSSGLSTVHINVRLLPRPATDSATKVDQILLVSFEDLGEPEQPSPKPSAKQGRGKADSVSINVMHLEDLEKELAHNKETLQATIEEQQATNEELQSTNEELQSTNEELQSSNEELETSKEELQSLNEETITVNSELSTKVEQLIGMQDDMKNLFDNISAGVMFLDNHLLIRRFTPETTKVFRLIPTDVGRPLSDIASNIEGEDLIGELQAVIDKLIPIEREVRTREGAWFLARMQPYRTLDNVIAGVALTFTSITEFKLASIKLAAMEAHNLVAEGIVNTVAEPLLVLNSDLRVNSASASFYQRFSLTPEQTVGQKIYDLGRGQWNMAALRQLLEDRLSREPQLEGYPVEIDLPGLGKRRVLLNARRVVTLGTTTILLAITAIQELDNNEAAR